MPYNDGAAEIRRARLLASFARRRLLASAPGEGAACDDGAIDAFVAGPLTKWGQPAWRSVPMVGETCAPRGLVEANPRQKRFVEIANAAPPCGDNACAAWIEAAWARMGLELVTGDACELYERYCSDSDIAQLKVGMVIAVLLTPFSSEGLRYGHVGLYAGDGIAMDCTENTVRHVPLDLWLSTYDVMREPRWGWLAHIDLSA